MRRLCGASIVISVMLALEMLASVSSLPDLRSLETPREPSPDTDLNTNKTRVDSKLSGTTIKPLSEKTAVDNDAKVKSSNKMANVTSLSVKLTPKTEYRFIYRWAKRRIAPLRPCDSLENFQFIEPKVEELPDRWAACPRLKRLAVREAKNLTKLPANLLEGATALQFLDFTDGVLESLPDGFLVDATNLRLLNLNKNRLTTLTSAVLVGPTKLESLDLENNLLSNEAMLTVGSLTNLTSLDISNNRISNLCERNGYSTFKNLTKLSTLCVKGLNITHICRDWSEMKFLKHLNIGETQVTELDFADVYLTKDPTVVEMMYLISYVNLKKVIFTFEEYVQAVRSPPKTKLLLISNSPAKADCETYSLKMLKYMNLSWIPDNNVPCLIIDVVKNK